MLNWRFGLQMLLFLLILTWLGLCFRLSYDVLKEKSVGHRHLPDLTATGCQLFPYDLLVDRAVAMRHRHSPLDQDRVYDNGYSSRLVDLVYRNAMKSTNDRRRQEEFEQRVAAARQFMDLANAAANSGRAGRFRLVTAMERMPVNVQGTIHAAELVAADDYNVARFVKRYRRLAGR